MVNSNFDMRGERNIVRKVFCVEGRIPINDYEKWLSSMKMTAWCSYILVSNYDYQKIKIDLSGKYGALMYKRKVNYADTARHWRRWSRGEGSIKKEVILSVEKEIPGSASVYHIGPTGVCIWRSLFMSNPISLLHSVKQKEHNPSKYMEDICFLPSDTELELSLSNTSLKNQEAWLDIFETTVGHLSRNTLSNTYQLKSDPENIVSLLFEAQSKAQRLFVDTLIDKTNELNQFGLYPQDFFYLLSTGNYKYEKSISFKNRLKYPLWKDPISCNLESFYKIKEWKF